jgi:hypothetical protein
MSPPLGIIIMNFAVNRSSNRSSEFPSTPDRQPSGADQMSSKPKPIKINNSETPNQSSSVDLTKEREHPIPPPSHPRQYRAIGLIRGKYQLSGEQLTQGTLTLDDGTTIEAVLLGRVISLVKNHLDLEQNHLWVVYPRTKQNEERLHVQIVGVWEPETLRKEETSSAETKDEPEDGYFSIRGEVIYSDREQETAIVKIKQFPKKESERVKFFKLQLKGTFSEKPIRHFWDFKVELDGQTLKIVEATNLGMIPVKKRPDFRRGGEGRKPYPPGKRPYSRPSLPGSSGSSSGSGATGARPIPKPTKPTGTRPQKPEK